MVSWCAMEAPSWDVQQGVGRHSPLAIQAHSGQVSTLPTWKKRDQFSHELGTVLIITGTLGTN